jgi:magnesium-protoporphyrin O-methyltransferase
MGNCCARHGQEELFKDRFARRMARRYRKKGLGKTSKLLVERASAGGLDGATVVEIGGGVGQIMLELLKAGAARGEVVELLPAYEDHARALAEEAGVGERASFRTADLVADPAAGEPADVVVMNRVVCCTPDGVELTGIAASLARRRLVLVFPRPSALATAVVGVQNLYFRLLRRRFRVFIHSPAAIAAAAEAHGLRLAFEHAGRVWQVAAFERA